MSQLSAVVRHRVVVRGVGDCVLVVLPDGPLQVLPLDYLLLQNIVGQAPQFRRYLLVGLYVRCLSKPAAPPAVRTQRSCV